MRSAAAFQTVADTLAEGLIVTDMDGNFLVFNAEAERIIGLGPQAGGPDTWSETYGVYNCIGPLAVDDLPLVRALKGETVRGKVLFIKNPVRQQGVYVRCNATPIIEDGVQVGAVVTFSDITDLKTVEANLQASNEELRQFAYGASHDLREPLGKIKAFGQRLEERYADKLDERGVEYLGIMRSAADRMMKLIDDLLKYSQIGASTATDPVDLARVVADVFGLFTERLEGAEVFVSDKLPTIRGDETQMFTLFQNIISNAIKFKKPDQPPRIWVTATETPDLYVVEVKDNGIGFDQQHAERIFRIFERLHTRFEYPGTGIGLALCKRIVERHGGTITAQGVPGEGATFRVALPKKV